MNVILLWHQVSNLRKKIAYYCSPYSIGMSWYKSEKAKKSAPLYLKYNYFSNYTICESDKYGHISLVLQTTMPSIVAFVYSQY